MDFGAALNRAWRIITLDQSAIDETAGDPNGLLAAVLITALGGACAGIGSLNPLAVVSLPVIQVVGLFISGGIYHLIASLGFGGKAEYTRLVQTLGHPNGLLLVVGILPIIGGFLILLTSLWGIVVSVLVVERVEGISRGAAVATVLIPIVVFFGLCACLFVVFGLGSLAFLGAVADH